MRFLMCSILALTLVMGGCSSTARFNRQAAKARAFDMNLHAIRGPVTIHLNTQPDPEEAEFFTIQADSAFWTNRSTGAPFSAPLSAVNQVSVNDQMTGLVNGMLIGAGIGFGLAYSVEDDSRRSMIAIPAGYLAGSLLGYIFGFKRDYIFEDAPPR